MTALAVLAAPQREARRKCKAMLHQQGRKIQGQLCPLTGHCPSFLECPMSAKAVIEAEILGSSQTIDS
jgi:hypothetical protein